MNTIKVLERRRYVTTPQLRSTYARELFAADRAAAGLSSIYHKMLLADTCAELGVEPRLRSAAGRGKLNAETIETHVAALNTVHGRFYETFLAELADVSAEERNSRTGFARSSKSEVLGYIKAGKDITALAPARVSKGKLRAQHRPRAATAKSVERKARGLADRIAKVGAELAETDKPAAIAALYAAIATLSDALTGIGNAATTDPKIALRDHRPLRVPGVSVFQPVLAANDIHVRATG